MLARGRVATIRLQRRSFTEEVSMSRLLVSNVSGCPLKARRSLLPATVMASLLTLWVSQPFALGKSQTQDTKNKQIEVRLIPKKKAIKVGEDLEVRVEIWNTSGEPFFIPKAIHEFCGPSSPLSLRLELGPPIKPQEGYGCASDCLWHAGDGFARRLVMGWTSLPAGSFYGTVISMHSDEFPQLNRPGRWLLRGSYESAGDLSAEVVCLDAAPIPNNKELIDNLPYKAWRGSVNTNTVWIEVVSDGRSPKVKKSP